MCCKCVGPYKEAANTTIEENFENGLRFKTSHSESTTSSSSSLLLCHAKAPRSAFLLPFGKQSQTFALALIRGAKALFEGRKSSGGRNDHAKQATGQSAFLGLISKDFCHSGRNAVYGRRPTCRYSRPAPETPAFIQTVNFGFIV